MEAVALRYFPLIENLQRILFHLITSAENQSAHSENLKQLLLIKREDKCHINTSENPY